MEIIYCINNSCELRFKCMRNKINNDESNHSYWISYAYFQPSENNFCSYFFSDERTDDENYELTKNIPC